jgi:hypothetical protein
VTDEITEGVLRSTMFAGLFGATIGALSVETWLAIGGFSIAVISLFVNIFHKRAMRKIERHKVDIERHKAGLPPLEK